MKLPEIVLIEDNPGDVFLVELALKQNQIAHTLTHFESARDAVEVLCGTSPGSAPPDLILMDLNTPRMDGFDALIQLKQSARLAGVPIAILTSSQARRDKLRAEGLGAKYLEKPSPLDDFLATVGNAVKELLPARP